MIVLLTEQRLMGDSEGVEKDDGFVVEKSVGERLARREVILAILTLTRR